ncbi:response regulator transcription factor [Microvirga sp. ACRRW]|uniref:LuxR C-terminal-related transcriptional regulator n=1 Tax=Microvirga sp. ACRRW TaxID=2918205 RepID=UPI001EF6A901|nr:response regulator transcription factor [Microvirga sp. ACRRW]MCG7394814.1 response regulator transcription factor [Microvirga sp. ACRRW]
MGQTIRVGVVDKHPLFRDGMVLALNSQPDLEVVGQGASTWDAVRITQDKELDVLVIDADIIEQPEDAEMLRQKSATIGIIILADTTNEERVRTALMWGVRGFLLKGTNRTELVQAVRVLSQGQSFLSPSLAAKLLRHTGGAGIGEAVTRDRLPRLTPREQQILSILVQGRSNKEIGNTLHLSEKTIKHHLTNILQKMRARNRVEAALIASNNMPPQLAVLEPKKRPHLGSGSDTISDAGSDTLLLRLA